MISYWAEFARHGAPGDGGVAGQPIWTPWAETGPSTLISNTQALGGIRMGEARIRVADLKSRLKDDSNLAAAEKCAIYERLFGPTSNNGGDYWDEAEYKAWGCSAGAS